MSSAHEDLVNRVCPDVRCGVPYAIPRHVFEQAKSLGGKRSYWCPNGHEAVVTETNEARLTKRVEELEKNVEGLRSIKCGQEEELEKAERTIRYWRGWAKHWKALAQARARR